MQVQTTMDIGPAVLLDEVREIALRAGAVILDIYGREFEVREKSDASPVTEADEAAEAVILSALRALTPDIPVIAEEEVAVERLEFEPLQQPFHRALIVAVLVAHPLASSAACTPVGSAPKTAESRAVSAKPLSASRRRRSSSPASPPSPELPPAAAVSRSQRWRVSSSGGASLTEAMRPA